MPSANPPRPVNVGIVLHERLTQSGSSVMAINRSYLSAIEGVGAIPRALPTLSNADHLRALYDDCDALIFPGGPDIDPGKYGQAVDPNGGASDINYELDNTELRLLEWALADRKPVLGICRGLQLINVGLGGTLWQDLRQGAGIARNHQQNNRQFLAHGFEIVPNTLLHRLLAIPSMAVNTMHHQGIRDVAPGLVVNGYSDGLVEGIELPDRPFFLAVQFHPEELTKTTTWAKKLFAGLVNAGREFREQPQTIGN